MQPDKNIALQVKVTHGLSGKFILNDNILHNSKKGDKSCMKSKKSLLKAICFISVAYLICFTLYACDGNKFINTNSPAPIETDQQNPSPALLVDGDIPFTYRIIGVDRETFNMYRSIPKKCSSYSELKKYLGDYAPKEYDEVFFKDTTLALCFEESTSGSVEHVVKNVKRNGNTIQISIDTSVPLIGTANMSYRCIIVELDNNLLKNDDVFSNFGLDMSELKQDSICPPGLVNGDIPFKYRIVSTDRIINMKNNYVKCQTTGELIEYLGNYAPEEYDDNFFQNNALIFMLIENSISTVSKVTRSGSSIFIQLGYSPSELKDDKKYSYIALELENTFLDKDDLFMPIKIDFSLY